MLITISGLPGSGKSTVAGLLAKKLRLPRYSIGNIRREMAKERGLTLEAFNALGEKKAFTDRHVDAWQRRQAKKLGKGVFEGRTSFYFIPESIKIFLTVSLRTGARRIMNDRSAHRRFEADWTHLSSVEQSLRRRIASDTKRYRQYYQINIFKPSHYDLVIDTTNQTPKQTFTLVLKYLAKISQENTKVGKQGKTHNYSTAKKNKLGKRKR